MSDPTIQGARLFFLGAGFSSAAGLPLADDLLRLVLDQVRISAGGGTNKLDQSIDRYRSYLKATKGEPPDKLNFEDLATFLDHEHILGLRGSDTWSEDGNEDQLMLRWGIGSVLNRMTPVRDAIPDLYVGFAQRLRGGDVVVTFNYDLILERSLDAAGVPYRRFPWRYSACYPAHSEVDSDRNEDEVVILKPHGSIDWVNRANFHSNYELPRLDLDEDEQRRLRRRDRVFGGMACSPTRRLVEGPRPVEDPLVDVYVLEDPDAYYAQFSTWRHTAPLLLAPSQAKLYYGAPLREFWRGMTHGAGQWRSLAVIGYSLPQSDPYTRQVLYELSAGHSYALAHPGWCAWPQSRMKVLDLQADRCARRQFLETYRFLDSNNTDFDFGGLSQSSIGRMFGGP